MAKIVEEEITVEDFFEVAEEVASVNGVVAVPVFMEADDETVPVYLDLLPDSDTGNPPATSKGDKLR